MATSKRLYIIAITAQLADFYAERAFDMKTTSPDVLTVKELSAFLRIGINAAYQLVRDGTVPSVRINRQYRIPRQAVLDYLGQPNSDTCA